MIDDERSKSSLPTLSDLLPSDVLDEAALADALEFLGQLASAIFPEGDVNKDLLSWPDRTDESQTLGNDARSTEERLKAAEARFVTLVEQIPAVTFMAVLGEGENDVYVSPHIEQMLGYTQEEWLSDPFLWYMRLHPDDRALWNQEFTRGCRTGGPFRAECRFIARDGRTVWVHGEARLVKDALGRPQFLQGVAFDITDSKKAQELTVASAVRDAKIEEELEIARRMQVSLLPRQPALRGLEIAARMIPAEEVGGDYYDVREATEGGFITIGDVSGHGLNAGLVMLMLQSAAAAIVTTSPQITPSEVVSLLNDVLYDNLAHRLERNDYVTLCVIRYREDGELIFAGAHVDMLVLRAQTGHVERIATRGPWLGIRRDIRSLASDDRMLLYEGDVLVLCTDGVMEAMNDEGELFDFPRLESALKQAGPRPVGEIRDHILARVQAFSQREQMDDITVIVARYKKPASA